MAETAKVAGTTRAGPARVSRRDMTMTDSAERSAAPIIAAGRTVSPKCVRKSASRVALPATS